MRTFATFHLCLSSSVSHFYYTTQYHNSSSWKEQNADHKKDLFPGKIPRPIINISLVLQPHGRFSMYTCSVTVLNCSLLTLQLWCVCGARPLSMEKIHNLLLL
jgi:hypothetical protein